jgi:hypothetical protein
MRRAKSTSKQAAKKGATRRGPHKSGGERAVLANIAALPGPDRDSQLISARIAELGGWRGRVLSHVRKLIKEADPAIVEEVKWRKPSNPAGVPVWSHNGIVCTGETYKEVVKLTFAKGAALRDPMCLFNSSLEGNVRRAIDIREGDEMDEPAFKALVRAAVSANLSGKKK